MDLTNRQFAGTWKLLQEKHKVTNEELGMPKDVPPDTWFITHGKATNTQWKALFRLMAKFGYPIPGAATSAPTQVISLSPLFAYLRKCGSSQSELAKALDMQQPNLSKLKTPTKLKREFIDNVFLEAKYLIDPAQEEGLEEAKEQCYAQKVVAIKRGAPKQSERFNLQLLTTLMKKHGVSRGKLAINMGVCPTRLNHQFKTNRMTPHMLERTLEELAKLLPHVGRKELRRMEDDL